MEEQPPPPPAGAGGEGAQAPIVFAHLQDNPDHADHFKWLTCDSELPLMAIFPDNAVNFATVPGKAAVAWEVAQLFFGSVLATEDQDIRAVLHERFYLTTDMVSISLPISDTIL